MKKIFISFFLIISSIHLNVFADVCNGVIPTIDIEDSISLAPDEIILNNSILVMSANDFENLVSDIETQIEAADQNDQQSALELVTKMNAPDSIGIVSERIDENDPSTSHFSAIGNSVKVIVAINPAFSGTSSVEFTETLW